MTLKTCRDLYEEHAKKVGSDYRFEFMKRVTHFRSAGHCNHSHKIIKLQPTYVELNNEETILNTILHELAHSLTRGHGHNYVWKRKAIQIGCNGKRCYGSEVIKIKTDI